MDKLEYLIAWAEMHAREVYGSPAEYVNIHDLTAEIRRIQEAGKR